MELLFPSLKMPRFSQISGWWLCVTVLTLGAALLRWFAISSQSFWFDESFLDYQCRLGLSSVLSWSRPPDLGNPPLFYILEWFWTSSFGHSELAVRSLSAVFGTLSVPLQAVLGRQLMGDRAALGAAGLLAISPTAIELSNEARPYALLGLLAIWGTFAFIRWVDTARPAWAIAYAVGTTLIVYTHYYGVFVPLAHGVALLVSRVSVRQFLTWCGWMALAAAIWAAIWLPGFLTEISTGGNLVRGAGWWHDQVLATPMVFGVGRNIAWRDSPMWELLALSAAVFVVFWLPAALGLFGLRSCRFEQALLGTWFGAPIVVPVIGALLGHPLYATRYAYVALPAFLLLVAMGLAILRLWAQTIFLGLLLGLSAVSIALYPTAPLKDDWRSITPTILDRLRPGEIVAFDPGDEGISFWYYAKRRPEPLPPMVGLFTQSNSGNAFYGVPFSDDEHTGEPPRIRDVTEEFTSTRGAWVVFLVPGWRVAEYQKALDTYGFRLVSQEKRGRCVVCHFVKKVVKGGVKTRSGSME